MANKNRTTQTTWNNRLKNLFETANWPSPTVNRNRKKTPQELPFGPAHSTFYKLPYETKIELVKARKKAEEKQLPTITEEDDNSNKNNNSFYDHTEPPAKKKSSTTTKKDELIPFDSDSDKISASHVKGEHWINHKLPTVQEKAKSRSRNEIEDFFAGTFSSEELSRADRPFIKFNKEKDTIDSDHVGEKHWEARLKNPQEDKTTRPRRRSQSFTEGVTPQEQNPSKPKSNPRLFKRSLSFMEIIPDSKSR